MNKDDIIGNVQEFLMSELNSKDRYCIGITIWKKKDKDRKETLDLLGTCR